MHRLNIMDLVLPVFGCFFMVFGVLCAHLSWMVLSSLPAHDACIELCKLFLGGGAGSIERICDWFDRSVDGGKSRDYGVSCLLKKSSLSPLSAFLPLSHAKCVWPVVG